MTDDRERRKPAAIPCRIEYRGGIPVVCEINGDGCHPATGYELYLASPPANRKAVIEECAKVCEALRDEWHARRISVPLPNDCAEAIRALAGAGGGKGT